LRLKKEEVNLRLKTLNNNNKEELIHVRDANEKFDWRGPARLQLSQEPNAEEEFTFPNASISQWQRVGSRSGPPAKS
jgi:rhodanese-related sulfurtransferase